MAGKKFATEIKHYLNDDRISLKDGRLYVTRTPYENGKQSGPPELVDVTEEVVDAILKVLNKRKMKETW